MRWRSGNVHSTREIPWLARRWRNWPARARQGREVALWTTGSGSKNYGGYFMRSRSPDAKLIFCTKAKASSREYMPHSWRGATRAYFSSRLNPESPESNPGPARRPVVIVSENMCCKRQWRQYYDLMWQWLKPARMKSTENKIMTYQKY